MDYCLHFKYLVTDRDSSVMGYAACQTREIADIEFNTFLDFLKAQKRIRAWRLCLTEADKNPERESCLREEIFPKK